MPDSPQARFKEKAQKRAKAIVEKMQELLLPFADPRYEYTDDQITKLQTYLNGQVNEICTSLKEKKKGGAPEFKL